MRETAQWIAPACLVADLQRLGVTAGQTFMVHSSVRAVGQLIGGPNSIIQTLIDVLTPAGTLMMYAGWEETPTDIGTESADLQALFYDTCPPYDPRIARAVREHGILVEFFRTWPGVLRSAHPDCSMIALGAQAAWLTANHPFHYGYGIGSPLHKLCEAGGWVLMLGAPLGTLTVLHYAEDRADLPNKRIKRYQCPILHNGQRVWVDLEEYDTRDTVIDAEYRFDTIALDYLAMGKDRTGVIVQVQTYLFESSNLAAFAIDWLEERFGDTR